MANAAEKLRDAEAPIAGFRAIFVPQDESPASLNALALAESLAVASGAQVFGLMFGLVPYYPISLTTVAAPEGWIHAQRQASDEAEGAEARLHRIYSKLAVPNELRRVDAFEQEVGRICARRARAADLTIMGWEDGPASDLDRTVFENCLFDSGRPLIVLPAQRALRTPPQRILIAWNGSRESARALREAIPLLRHARLTRLVVVEAERADLSEAEDDGEAVIAYLERHGVAIESKHAPSHGRDVATVLADEADQFGATMIVLGGFGYMRSGQWVLGNATRAALALGRHALFFAN